MKTYEIEMDFNEEFYICLSQNLIGNVKQLIVLQKDQIPMLIEWLKKIVEEKREK